MNVEALIEELAASLKLAERAGQDAVAGLPGTDATSPIAAEVNAVAAAEQAAKNEIQKVDRARAHATTALSGAQPTVVAVRRTREGVEDESPPPPPDLVRLAHDRDRARAAYSAFQSQHGLTRDATGDDRLTQVTVAVVVVLFESIINAYFYMPISSLGLTGGLFTAFFVSAVNVGVAFAGGALGLRHLGHVDPGKKLLGVIAFLLTLGGCAFVVALSALFRGHVDALGAGDLDGAALADEAWTAAVASLLSLDARALVASLNSFLLVFVGGICALLGYWKGWEFDDPYPGFGAAWRNRERGEAAYDEAREEAAQARAQWEQERRAKLREQQRRLDDKAAQVDAALAGLREAALQAGHPAQQAMQLADGLLSIYRQKNAEVRATPSPSYFSEPLGHDFSPLEEDLRKIVGELPRLEASAERFAKDCRAEQANLQAANTASDGE